jgi:hypothetical protein
MYFTCCLKQQKGARPRPLEKSYTGGAKLMYSEYRIKNTEYRIKDTKYRIHSSHGGRKKLNVSKAFLPYYVQSSSRVV